MNSALKTIKATRQAIADARIELANASEESKPQIEARIAELENHVFDLKAKNWESSR